MNTLKLNSAGLNRVTLNTIGEVRKKKTDVDENGMTTIENGVYIQHINGTFFTTEEWEIRGINNEKANGVAVKLDACSFVIAKEYFTKKTYASDTSTLVEGVTTTTDKASARADYAGRKNTNALLQVDVSQCAFVCANYEFPNGQKGYFPACGELYQAYSQKKAIDAAFVLIGASGLDITNTHYWSSTQYDNGKAWVMQWYNRAMIEGSKKYETYVRPFTELVLPK